MGKLTLEELVAIRSRLQEIGELWHASGLPPDERRRLREEWNTLETQLAEDEPDGK